MEKTAERLDDLLAQLSSLRDEVSKTAARTADAVFCSAESGDITKEEALTMLTDNELLPVAEWICLQILWMTTIILIDIQLSII